MKGQNISGKRQGKFRAWMLRIESISPTILAFVLTFVLYPMSIASIGTFSNGGNLGLVILSIALALSWWDFTTNNEFKWVRRFIQIPVVSIVTFAIIWDFCAQAFVTGFWRWRTSKPFTC